MADLAQELLDLDESTQIQKSVDEIQKIRDKEDEKEDLYIELLNDVRQGIIDEAKLFAGSKDSQFNKFHYIDLGSDFPPVLTKSTVEDPAWNVFGGNIRAPIITTVAGTGGQFGFEVAATFLEDDIISHLVFYLTGSLAGSFFAITDNGGPIAGDENDIEYTGTKGSIGDSLVITHLSITTDRIYTGASVAILASSSVGSFSSLPNINDLANQWEALRFLVFNSKYGTKIGISSYDAIIPELQLFADNLETRDELFNEILNAN